MVTNQIKLIDVVNLTVIEPLMVRQKIKRRRKSRRANVHFCVLANFGGWTDQWMHCQWNTIETKKHCGIEIKIYS